MKRIITILICIAMITVTIYKYNSIVNYVIKYFSNTHTVIVENKNKYYKNYDFNYVSQTDDFIPYNYQDLLNIFYTILNSGYDTFTFYCPVEYTDCITDIANLSNGNNADILTTIGNYVSPFNNFNSIKIAYDATGEVTINISHLYSDEEIENINNKIDNIYNEIITDDMSKEDIIYAFHDYIINNTKYDDNYEKEILTGTTTHASNKANGPLFEGYAICSGYTDVMAIVLDRLEIKNFKVASKTHVWNALYINDEWLNLDLTWDDPVSSDHSINTLLHKFYLIDTDTLESFNIDNHELDKSIYTELK